MDGKDAVKGGGANRLAMFLLGLLFNYLAVRNMRKSF